MNVNDILIEYSNSKEDECLLHAEKDGHCSHLDRMINTLRYYSDVGWCLRAPTSHTARSSQCTARLLQRGAGDARPLRGQGTVNRQQARELQQEQAVQHAMERRANVICAGAIIQL